MESHAPSEAELQTDTNADPEEAEQPNNVTPDDAREVSTSQQSEEQFSMFSSQEFELDAESAKESLASTPLPDTEPARDNETLTATAGASFSQDAQPSTSTDQANASAQGKTFWDKARQLASQRRRSRKEHSRVMSTEGGKSRICSGCPGGKSSIRGRIWVRNFVVTFWVKDSAENFLFFGRGGGCDKKRNLGFQLYQMTRSFLFNDFMPRRKTFLGDPHPGSLDFFWV